MTVNTLKDYYRILEVPPAAKADEIKKAYRRLALKFHPDTNPGEYAQVHFIAIKEAYEVLRDDNRRKKYDEERWLSGMSSRAKDMVAVTPEWILQESKRLHKHMQTIDTYRMSHSALHDYVFLLLSDEHMAVLHRSDADMVKRDIVLTILESVKNLRYEYMQGVGTHLARVLPGAMDIADTIATVVAQSRHVASREKYTPWIVVAITMALCVLMYLYALR